MGLLCRVATTHDVAEAMQLMNSSGWATLLAVLQESSGERPPPSAMVSRQKRRWEGHDDSYSSSGSSFDAGLASSSLSRPPVSRSDTGEQLAKRFKGASLK